EGSEPAWYYASARTQPAEVSATYLPARAAQPSTENGVDFVYYEGPDIKGTVDSIVYKGTEVLRGATSNFDIGGARVDDHFAFKFRSLLRVPRRGIYRFYTYSDDGSVLRVDGTKVVDNDGGHSARRREGSIALEAGRHLVEVDYIENYMGQELEVGFTSRDIPETVIPDSLLFRPGK
ncbi:MAG: metallophosphatase, partial [Candidatus Amulumruptor sp.]|nr:metallophosphatase [Candidatus Amulumruptor sp.]